jgi:hypothetical protein
LAQFCGLLGVGSAAWPRRGAARPEIYPVFPGMWQEFWLAAALLLVIEGIWPFLNPASLRQALLLMAEQNDRSLRLLGLFSMLSGVGLLYLLK